MNLHYYIENTAVVAFLLITSYYLDIHPPKMAIISVIELTELLWQTHNTRKLVAMGNCNLKIPNEDIIGYLCPLGKLSLLFVSGTSDLRHSNSLLWTQYPVSVTSARLSAEPRRADTCPQRYQFHRPIDPAPPPTLPISLQYQRHLNKRLTAILSMKVTLILRYLPSAIDMRPQQWDAMVIPGITCTPPYR